MFSKRPEYTGECQSCLSTVLTNFSLLDLRTWMARQMVQKLNISHDYISMWLLNLTRHKYCLSSVNTVQRAVNALSKISNSVNDTKLGRWQKKTRSMTQNSKQEVAERKKIKTSSKVLAEGVGVGIDKYEVAHTLMRKGSRKELWMCLFIAIWSYFSVCMLFLWYVL